MFNLPQKDIYYNWTQKWTENQFRLFGDQITQIYRVALYQNRIYIEDIIQREREASERSAPECL